MEPSKDAKRKKINLIILVSVLIIAALIGMISDKEKRDSEPAASKKAREFIEKAKNNGFEFTGPVAIDGMQRINYGSPDLTVVTFFKDGGINSLQTVTRLPHRMTDLQLAFRRAASIIKMDNSDAAAWAATELDKFKPGKENAANSTAGTQKKDLSYLVDKEMDVIIFELNYN